MATANNLTYQRLTVDYELLLNDHAALQKAIAEYVDRYTKLSEEKKTSETESKK